MVKPPHHLPNSYNGTPTPPTKQRRPSLSEGITPREKAKMMEEKRREDMRKQRELKEVCTFLFLFFISCIVHYKIKSNSNVYLIDLLTV